ncbi:polysaccharide deacetylase family protein [Amycolatopsis acidicola]|uniref:Polysaccharide deacetylase family protein n=1 Tax=Amycolatopsis acidicola TaxID=2596893 RepID=A0A5N0UK04_9PSEU|nr:polysaccharide deacetylase family protein [Amycolatopsis acidicola]KAA9148947.1 polysaccharide deacetylase family protein [Amycolatopsis acidicola]
MRYRVLRPPYCYRWAVLIAVLAGTVSLIVSLCQPGAEGSPIRPSPPPAVAAGPTAADPAPDLLRHTANTGKYVALTFDDGPDPAFTPRILDVLAKNNAVATFCMIGTRVRAHPELVRSVLAHGMRLCDHTVNHDEDLARRTPQRITAEIEGCWSDLQVAADADVAVGYFRAPGGAWSQPMREAAARAGMKPLAWSVDPRDWATPGTQQIAAAVRQNVQPGSVILFHDGGGDRAQTVEALGILLPWLAGQGYRFDFPG